MKESERVQLSRKQNFDRISTLIDKGGKHLLHAQAIREGVSVAEMIRRAIYSRAGLRMLPYPDDLEALSEVTTQEEAEKAILRLQAKEESSEIIQNLLQQLSPEPDSARYELKVDHDTRRVLEKICAAEDGSAVVNGFDVGHLRRMLANMKPQDIAEK